MVGLHSTTTSEESWDMKFCVALVSLVILTFAHQALAAEPGKVPGHQSKAIAGWSLLIHDELLEKDRAGTERALELLTSQLQEITSVVPAKAVAELRKVPLWLSPEYPGVEPRAEYHPGAGWLRDNKRNPAMAKAVEFTNIRIFERETKRMPNFTLHELAHAYHDRVLAKGFGNEAIKAAFLKAKEKGLYEQVEQRFGDGRSAKVRAYAMTSPMEYFAECTEAFFSTNDFFPFTREQLARHDPEMFALLQVLWGTSTDASKPVKVFLFAGQSNMVGADAHAERIDNYPEYKGAGEPQKDVLYSYILGDGNEASKGWVDLQPLRSFGPEVTFARRVKQHIDSPIAIIKSAVGGTTVAFDWNPAAPDKGQKLYPRTLQRIRDSLAELDKRGVRYQLEAVMWHQGENDMLDRKLYQQYAAGLTELIARLRTDLKAPELKWYIAEVSEKGIWGMDHRSNLSVLRQQQEQVLKADPLLRWVPTSHLAFEVMGSGQPHYHFGTQGQLQLGDAFAEAYLRDQGRPLPVTDRSFKNQLPIDKKARVRLFVIAGQRNAEGEDSFVSEIPQQSGFETLVNDQPQILFRYSLGGGVKSASTWEPLGPVDYLGNFGPELSFGERLRKSLDAKEGVAIIKFTHSGAQGPDWSPSGSPESHRNLYPKLLSFIQSAQSDLQQQGFDCSLEGVFWQTGENDTWFDPYARSNAKWMKELIDQTRIDLKQPNLAWFISEQHPNAPWRNMEAVNAALNELARSEPHLTIIKTSALPHGKRHFETQGTLLLGQAMADAYLQSRKDPK